MYYFGTWDQPSRALAQYNERRQALHSGKVERPAPADLTIGQLVVRFLGFKKARKDTNRLTTRTLLRYGQACNHVLAAFGRGRSVSDLGPDDFEQLYGRWAKLGWGPLTLTSQITLVKTLFKYAYDMGLLERPIRFGPGFAKPDQKTRRNHRAKKGKMIFSREELHTMLAAAEPALRAMILVGINCGFGNGDCGALPIAALDLEAGWLDFPRPKTGIERRCPLWPETVAALKLAIASRPSPRTPDDAALVFLTRLGNGWNKDTRQSPLSKEVKNFLDGLGITGHRNFYCLRRTFETRGGACRDQVAVDFIMGHAPQANDMAAVYRYEIDDDRLLAVTKHIHSWLFGTADQARILKLA
jgi:integrase